MNLALTNALFKTINAEVLARAEANAAEPYVHEVYEAHEARIKRMIAVLADGNDTLADMFFDALFDCTYDGLYWQRKVFKQIARKLAES